MARKPPCPRCGKELKTVIYRGHQIFCPNCEVELDSNDYTRLATVQDVVVRTYPGRTQAEAMRLFQADAATLSSAGYAPVAQSWMDGQAGIGRAALLGLGASVLRPDGMLSVTFSRRDAGQNPAPTVVVEDTKTCPMCAEQVKAAALICRFCRYEFPATTDA